MRSLCLSGKWIQQPEGLKLCVMIWVKGVPSKLFMTKPAHYKAQKKTVVITERVPRASPVLTTSTPLCMPGMLYEWGRILLKLEKGNICKEPAGQTIVPELLEY